MGGGRRAAGGWRPLWRANSRRPLLRIRIGPKGVQQSHRNSLSELLAFFHGVVCVKINVGGSARDGAGSAHEARALAAATAEMLRDQPEAALRA